MYLVDDQESLRVTNQVRRRMLAIPRSVVSDLIGLVHVSIVIWWASGSLQR